VGSFFFWYNGKSGAVPMGTALPQVTTEFLVNIKNNSPKSLEKKQKQA